MSDDNYLRGTGLAFCEDIGCSSPRDAIAAGKKTMQEWLDFLDIARAEALKKRMRKIRGRRIFSANETKVRQNLARHNKQFDSSLTDSEITFTLLEITEALNAQSSQEFLDLLEQMTRDGKLVEMRILRPKNPADGVLYPLRESNRD